jgi:peptide/nickel transport system substrate-binding protein
VNNRFNRRSIIKGAAALGVAAPFAGYSASNALASVGLGNPTQLAASLQDGGQAVLGAWLEPATLLSGAPVTSAAYQQIQRLIANGLTVLAYPSFDVQPDLATEWTVSDDGLTYVFTLREGVTWHDGEAFTADDVKFTFDLVTHPEFAGALDSYFINIDGATAHKDGTVDTVTGITVIDDTHIQFVLTQPDTLFLSSALSRQRILPQHILGSIAPVDVDKSEFTRLPIYTGPYKVESWQAGESISFSANPNYYGGVANIPSVVARFIPDAAAAHADLQTGALSLGTTSPELFDSFVNDDNFTTQDLPGLRVVTLQFDLNLPLFADIRVRQAISHAIDRDTVIQALYLGRAEVAVNYIPPQSWVNNPDVVTFPYDPDRANQLLEEAGWTREGDGVRTDANGNELAFTLTVQTAVAQDALAIVPFIEAIGFKVTINQLGAGQITGPLKVGEYEATIVQWNNFIIDPRADLQRTFQNPRPTDSTGYRNDTVDALFGEARAATDRETETQLWFELQALVANDAPVVYLWRQHDLLVVNNAVTVPEVTVISELYARIPEWTLSE